MDDRPSFIFVTCQVGAEIALKAELASHSLYRLAFSRPGFLTFKLPGGHTLPDDFDLHSVFARAYGFSLGKVSEGDAAVAAKRTWEIAGNRPYTRLHVWRRDTAPVGYRGFEPGPTTEAHAAEQAIVAACPLEVVEGGSQELLAPTAAGDLVLDCVLVEPSEWWIGYHRASSPRSRWVGGMPSIDAPPDMISRAYLKIEEALAWSRLPLKAGHTVVEIGSAPGGSSQALLNRGLLVTGVDPGDMDPYVLAHPSFVHIKKRGADVRRRDYRGLRWLVADMNVAPNYTLDTVESIVTHPEVQVEGMLLTLKLLEWNLAAEIPQYLDRIRAWGYTDVRARQLAHNRQEICVAALKQRSLRRRSSTREIQRKVPE